MARKRGRASLTARATLLATRRHDIRLAVILLRALARFAPNEASQVAIQLTQPRFRLGESPDLDDAVHFRVGMSYQSLLDCNHNVMQQACLWTIRDGSLSVFGDQEEMTLTFCSVQGTLIQRGVSLIGEELNGFKYAVNALAFRKKVALN